MRPDFDVEEVIRKLQIEEAVKNDRKQQKTPPKIKLVFWDPNKQHFDLSLNSDNSANM